MRRTDRQEEEKWLERVNREVDDQLAEALGRTSRNRGQMREIRRVMWEEMSVHRTSDHDRIGQQIADLHQQGLVHRVYSQDARKLGIMQGNPYFGRIDFREEGLPQESLYIGLGSLLDRKTKEPLVYDWRAPIASMFYDYGLGAASYQSLDGEIAGYISRKRQYKIADGKLVFMFDNELKIDDEVLQQALGRQADEKMRHIVNTIQREQNVAIRNEEHQVLVVDGPAGSGKTSVALHRVAYLLYKHRGNLRAHNVVIFSPNQVFGEYISRVLPDLGEENVLQTTFQEFVDGFFEHAFRVESLGELLETLLTREGQQEYVGQRIEGIRLTSSSAFVGVLRDFCERLDSEGVGFRDVSFAGKRLMSDEEMRRLFFESYGFLPFARRLVKIKQRLAAALRVVKKEMIVERYHDLRRADSGILEDSHFELARQAIAPVRKQAKAFAVALDSWLRLDYQQAYLRLLSDRDLLGALGHEDNLAVHRWRKATSSALKQGRICYQDVAPLLYLKGRLEGFPIRNRIRHVVIDEVQDYSPLQLAILREVFPNSRFTLLGDGNQSVNPALWSESGAGIAVPFLDQMGCIHLTRSYRSTREISQFCQALLARTPGMQTVIRTGDKPRVEYVPLGQEGPRVAATIRRWQSQGCKSMAIICKSAQQSRDVHEEIVRLVDSAFLITRGNEGLETGLVVLPVYLAKGLEFDAVMLWGASADNYGQPYHRNLLYVACSRALHQLHVMYSGELSPFVAAIDDDLFEQEAHARPSHAVEEFIGDTF